MHIGRGLTEETRPLAMLDFLLEDWMPWYPGNSEKRDYSTLDPNRLVIFYFSMMGSREKGVS